MSQPPNSNSAAFGSARWCSSKRAGWLASVAFGLVAALIAFRTIHECNVPGRPDLPFYGMQDFRDTIYYPARAFLAGVDPYDAVRFKDTYPIVGTLGPWAPAVLWLFVPFAMLSLPQAEIVFFLLNLALVPLVATLILRLCHVRQPTVVASLGLGAVLLATRQGHSTLFLGQNTLWLLVGVFAALYHARSRPWIAGLALALAATKPTFGVPLAILMLGRAEWRPVAIGSGILGVLSVPVVVRLVQNAGSLPTFLQSFSASSGHLMHMSVNSTHTLRIDAPALFERFTGAAPMGSSSTVLTFAIVAIGLVAVWRAGEHDDHDPLVDALICLTVLTCTYHQIYDSMIAALPLTALALGTWRPELPTLGRHTRPVLLGLLLVPAVNWLSSFHAIERLGMRDNARVAVESVNGVAMAAALLLCTGLALTGRPPRAVPRTSR